jgi:hypothetical protein
MAIEITLGYGLGYGWNEVISEYLSISIADYNVTQDLRYGLRRPGEQNTTSLLTVLKNSEHHVVGAGYVIEEVLRVLDVNRSEIRKEYVSQMVDLIMEHVGLDPNAEYQVVRIPMWFQLFKFGPPLDGNLAKVTVALAHLKGKVIRKVMVAQPKFRCIVDV